MRQLAKNDTIFTFFVSLLITHLLFLPMAYDISAATLESGETTIANYPSRIGRYGQQVTIRAHIAHETPIKKVTLVVENGKKPLTGNMPKLKQIVPVYVQAMREVSIRSGAAANKNLKGRLSFGDMMQVSGEKNGYYRGVSMSGIKGYILKSDVEVMTTGHAYAVTLPSSITSRAKLVYHIEAVDERGAVTRTETVSMRLLTEEEIDMFLAMYGGGAAPAATPIYKKPLFWVGMGAVAGGVYILSSDKGDSENTTTTEVLVEWE